MGRRPKCRFVGQGPVVKALKPAGVPARCLETVELGLDELEAIRLADLEGLYFDAAGELMGLSRATFGRLVERARHKVADAVVNGKMLVFKGGHVMPSGVRVFHCDDCGWDFEAAYGTGRPQVCPACDSRMIRRSDRGQRQSGRGQAGQGAAPGPGGVFSGQGRGRRRVRGGWRGQGGRQRSL